MRYNAKILIDEDNNYISNKNYMKYLGAQLHVDDRIESEIVQKIAMASQDFKELKQIWNHSNITRAFKFEIFNACVIQKLLYSLEST